MIFACDLMAAHYAQRVAISQGDLHTDLAYLFAMRSPGERLKAARVAAGYESAPAAAQAMGVPEATYMGHENGSRGFGRAAERYARFFRTTPEWLLYGRGESAGVADAPAAYEQGPVGRIVDLADLRTHIAQIAKPRPVAAKMRMRPIERRIPVVGEVAAGVWRETVVRAMEDVDEYLEMDVAGYERAQLTAMRVVGPSMNRIYPEGRYVVVAHPAEAGLRVGDYVVVQRQKLDVFEITLKEFTYENGRIALWPRSTHPDFQEPIYLADNGDHDQTAPVIVGVVVADFGRRERPPVLFEPRSE